MDNDTAWKDRCERYFSSLTESDKTQGCGQMKNKEWQSLGNVKNTSSETLSNITGSKEWLKAINLHGLSFAGTSYNTVEIFVWTTIPVVACGALAFFFYLIIVSYITQSDNFTIVSKVHETMVFPVVTLCNLNMFKSSAAKSSYHNRFSDLLYLHYANTSAANLKLLATKDAILTTELYKLLSNHLESPDVHDILDRLDKLYLPFQTMSSIKDWQAAYKTSGSYFRNVLRAAVRPSRSEIKELGHKAKDLIVNCLQSGEQCQERNYVEDEDPDYGKCVAIKPNYKSLPGKQELVLNIEPHEYISALSPTVGVRIFIHDDNSSIHSGAEFTAYPGSHLHIVVKKVTTTHQQGPCNAQGNYRRKQCLYQCLDDMVLKYCKCRNSIDSPSDQRCKVNVQFEYVCLHSLIYLQQLNHLGCNCPKECSYAVYDAIASSAQWPSDSNIPHMRHALAEKGLSMSVSEIRSSLSYVTISSDSVEKDIIKQTDEITVLVFLTRIGGISALLTGASILTVIEGIWLLIRVCLYWSSKLCERAKRKDSIQKLSESEFTSITWNAYKRQRRIEVQEQEQHKRKQVLSRFRNSTSSRRSFFVPTSEVHNSGRSRPYHHQNNSYISPTIEYPFNKPAVKTHVHNSVKESKKGNGSEFPIFHSIMEDNQPFPRYSTAANSEHRSTSALLQLEGDAKLYPERALLQLEGDAKLYPKRGRIISPADAIQLYGKSSSKYFYSDPFLH